MEAARRAGRGPRRKLPALAAGLALASAWQACRREAFLTVGPPGPPGRPGRVARRASDEEDAQGVWREAYEAELGRNVLLREQLREEQPGAKEADREPEECGVDWSENYERLQECNQAIEARLRGASPPSPKAVMAPGTQQVLSEEELQAREPVVLGVELEERKTSIEVFRRLGAGSVFYTLRAPLPLGLQITRVEKGDMRGSFLVESVVEGASERISQTVRPGDVLHALTTEVSTMGTTTFDSGQMSRYQQLVDTSFLNSVEMLVEAMLTNSPGDDLVLLLERSAAAVRESEADQQG